MRILIAPDSFKESLDAREVAAAIARGVQRALPDAELLVLPMADGGEGTVDAMVAAAGGEQVQVEVTGPLGEPVQAVYGLLHAGRTAVIELAAASGLALSAQEKRDPRVTTTYGTGELIRHALDTGVREILVGLGGSATNDGGAGIACALGYRLLDPDGHDLAQGGAALAQLDRIDASGVHPALGSCSVRVACDVTNPLCGPEGASKVYGPQKGATPQVVEELDAALAHLAAVVQRDLGISLCDVPGGGAAGGAGAGFVAFTRARLESGFALVAESCGLAESLLRADLAFTGEGRLDHQTLCGKTPFGVAHLARAAGVPLVALAGSLGPGYEALYSHGVTTAFSILDGPRTLDSALHDAAYLLEEAAASATRLWLAGRQGQQSAG